MKLRKILFLIFFLFFSKKIFSEEIIDLIEKKYPYYPFSTTLDAGYFVPVGYYQDLLSPGFLFQFSFSYNPELFNYFLLNFETGFFSSQFKNAKNQNYQLVPFGLLLHFKYPLGKDFSLSAKLGGGYYLLSLASKTYQNLFAKASLSINYDITSHLAVSLSGEPFYFHDPQEGIQALNASLGFSYIFGEALAEKDIEVVSLTMNSLFSALYSTYYKEPVGFIKIKNTSGEALSGIQITLFIKQYMESETRSSIPFDVLKPGETAMVPLSLFFNDNIRLLENDLLTTGVIEISYIKPGERLFKKRDLFQLKIFQKNSLVWDNLNKLGSFISYSDKTIQDFARKILSFPLSESVSGISPEMAQLVKIFQGLSLYGIFYVKDPSTPYKSFGAQKVLPDTIQYPRETLLKKTGDCDDLSVLASAVLESIGIRTAFVTIPGHIFLLVEAQTLVSDKLVVYQDKKWIPVETTLLGEGLVKAWQEGYKNFISEKPEEIKTAYEAFSSYHPVLFENFPEIDFNPELETYQISYDQAVRDFKTMLALKKFSDNELKSFSPARLNKEGIIFAQSGDYEEALKLFEMALEKDKKYKYSYYNLVQLCLFKKDFKKGEETIRTFLSIFSEDERIKGLKEELENLKKKSKDRENAPIYFRGF